MAFPTIAAQNTSSETTATTTHDVLVPTGISAGNLLLAIFNHSGSTGPGDPGWTTAGWTQFVNVIQTGNTNRLRFAYKFAAGGESDFTLTTNGSVTSVNRTFRITGAHASTAPEGTAASGLSSTPDPASLDPTNWASEDNLWIAVVGYDDGTVTVSAYPTNYSNGQNDRVNDAGAVGLGTATRNLNASSDDPGTFTLSASRAHVVGLIAVRPAASAATARPDFSLMMGVA